MMYCVVVDIVNDASNTCRGKRLNVNTCILVYTCMCLYSLTMSRALTQAFHTFFDAVRAYCQDNAAPLPNPNALLAAALAACQVENWDGNDSDDTLIYSDDLGDALMSGIIQLDTLLKEHGMRQDLKHMIGGVMSSLKKIHTSYTQELKNELRY